MERSRPAEAMVRFLSEGIAPETAATLRISRATDRSLDSEPLGPFRKVPATQRLDRAVDGLFRFAEPAHADFRWAVAM